MRPILYLLVATLLVAAGVWGLVDPPARSTYQEIQMGKGAAALIFIGLVVGMSRRLLDLKT
jgi:hypothetical protein